MERISWTEKITNVEILKSGREQVNVWDNSAEKEKFNIIMRGDELMKEVMWEKIEELVRYKAYIIMGIWYDCI